MMLFGKN